MDTQRQDRELQLDERFGQSQLIVGRVRERYRFAIDLLASQHPELAGPARTIEAFSEEAADELFGDVLIRAALERAIERLETGDALAEAVQSLERLLAAALASTPAGSVARQSMAGARGLGPQGRIWVWDLVSASRPMADELRQAIRTGFMPGAKSSVEILQPTPVHIRDLDRACQLLARLLPESAASVFRHLHSIAVARIQGSRGRMLTGSGGDGTPCMIFIDPDELANPWDTAGHILHEGIHLKLSDIARTGALVFEDPMVELPWGRRTALSNCIFAFHAYAHVELLREAVTSGGPDLHAEFGPPERYRAPAHAMSLVNTSGGGGYSHGRERLEYLGTLLQGAQAPRVTPFGRALIRWLWETVAPLRSQVSGRPAPASDDSSGEAAEAPAAPFAVRYGRHPDLFLRGSSEQEVLFAPQPDRRKILTLNLSAWLAFELCDGRTGEEVLCEYARTLNLDAGRARLELATTLEQLVASSLVVPSNGARSTREGRP